MRARAAELAIWLSIALALIAPSLADRDAVPGDGVDLYGTLWFFSWARDCVEALADPGWTPYFFFPHGKDIFAHTGNNLVDAVLSLPLQWVFGYPAFYKWWVVAVFLSNAAAFRLLARELVPDRFAAAVATVLYAVNPYLLYELQCGRPTQAMTCFLLLAFLQLHRLERPRDAVLCGVAVALTGWTYWYYAFFFCFCCLWLVPALVWQRPDRQAWLRGLGIAALVAVILVLPAVIPMVLRDLQGAIPGLDRGHGWLDVPRHTGPRGPTHGYTPWEPSGPRLLLSPVWAMTAVGWLIFGTRRRTWTGVAAIALVLAAGASVQLLGRRLWSVPYLVLYNELPFWSRLWFPYRAVVIVMMVIALGGGLLLARLSLRGDRWRRAAWVIGPLAVAGSLAMSWGDASFPLTTWDASAPAAWRWMGGLGGAVIELPTGVSQQHIVYQPVHRLPLFGGMAEEAPLFHPAGHELLLKNPFVRALVADGSARPVAWLPSDRAAFEALGFRWVVLHRDLVDEPIGDAEVTRRLTGVVGEPVAVDGPMVVWSLVPVVGREDSRPSSENLQGSWERRAPPAYAKRLDALGRSAVGPPR